jgi:hypothetical protein
LAKVRYIFNIIRIGTTLTSVKQNFLYKPKNNTLIFSLDFIGFDPNSDRFILK